MTRYIREQSSLVGKYIIIVKGIYSGQYGNVVNETNARYNIKLCSQSGNDFRDGERGSPPDDAVLLLKRSMFWVITDLYRCREDITDRPPQPEFEDGHFLNLSLSTVSKKYFYDKELWIEGDAASEGSSDADPGDVESRLVG